MADIVINTKVNAPDGNALAAIKKELKEMKSLALNGDGAAAKRVAELTDKLEDLKDTTKSLKGDGVERLQGSFALLNESLRTGDVGKFGTALKGVGQAMSAIPLLLVIEGIKVLIDNFDKVTEYLKIFFNVATDGEKEIKKLNKELENTKKINEASIAAISNEIRVMEAQGKSKAQILAKQKELNALKIKELEIDIELQKAKIKEIFLNDSITETITRQTIALQRKLGNDKVADTLEKALFKDKLDRAKEQTDAITKDAIAIANLKTDIQIAEINNDKEQFKQGEELRAKRKKADEDELKAYDERLAYIAKQNEAIAKQKEADRLKGIEDLNLSREEELNAMSLYLEEDLKIKAEKKKKEEEMDKYAEEQKKLRAQREVEIEKNVVASLTGLSELYFNQKLAMAEGDEVAQLEIKKRAFQVDKAFRVAQATIDGIGSVTKTLASGGALALPLAISMGVLAAVNIAKILATKFNPGSTGGGGVSIKPSISSGGGNSQPVTNQLPKNNLEQNQSNTTFDDNGNKTGGTNWISIKEVRDVDRRVNRVTEQTKF
jgi:hypothetical protein